MDTGSDCQFSIEVQPSQIKAGKRGQIVVRNKSDEPQTFKLTWLYDLAEVDIIPPGLVFTVSAKDKVIAKFQANSYGRRWFGQTQYYPISVQVTLAEDVIQTHQVQVISHSLFLPIVLPILLLLAVSLAVIGGGVGYWRMVVVPAQTAQANALVAASATATAATAEAIRQANEAMTATMSWLEQDEDGDGLTNGQEQELGTRLDQADTDQDGLDDGHEVNTSNTDPLQVDTDGDGLEDGQEVSQGINPQEIDSDRDGIPDAQDEDPKKLPTVTATPTSTGIPTETPQPPTVTPARAPTRLSIEAPPTVSEPTVIPLTSGVSIAEIGSREVIDVDINPQNPREVYTLVKGDGIYKSSNGGDAPWIKMNVDGTAITAFVIAPTDPARFYAPTWNGVLKSTDGGNIWNVTTNGLGIPNRPVDVVAVHPANPDIIYGSIGETLIVSTNGGDRWRTSADGYGKGLGLARFYQIVIDPFNPDIIYVGGAASEIYKSVDTGRNFIRLPINVGQGAFSLAAHPTQKDVYLAGIKAATAGIIKTENGLDFQSVSTGLIFGGADSAYSAIAYAPSNLNIVYAGSGYEDDRFAKGIFKSTDGAENWTRISDGLRVNQVTGQPHYVKIIAVHPTNPDLVLAATGSGLYKSINGGTTWNLR